MMPEFDDALLSELREALASVIGVWKVLSVRFADGNRSRVICTVAGDGREVRAIIDASDFRDLIGKSRRADYNRSSYNDLVFNLSILLEEEIFSYRPQDLPDDEVRIRPQADRPGPAAPDQGGHGAGWFSHAPLSGVRRPSGGSRRLRN